MSEVVIKKADAFKRELAIMVERQKLEFAIQELEFVEMEIASCQKCVGFVESSINRLNKRLEEL